MDMTVNPYRLLIGQSRSRPLRVAIVGSGPSGFYAAESLLRSDRSVEVDMFEKLPTPYGLVRYGVAPDHQKLKEVTRVFDRIAGHEGFHFFGNVEVGHDVAVTDLWKFYHGVVFACGAEDGRRLNLPGEALPGSISGRDFVSWYNGHPHYRDLKVDLSCDAAVVIGHGNVALDVARILAKPADDLARSDIADHALRCLETSRIQDIYLVGRRGPADAKFTIKELREIFTEEAWITLVDEKYRDSLSDDHQGDRSSVEYFRIAANSTHDSRTVGAAARKKRIHFEFFQSPECFEGGRHLEAVRFRRMGPNTGSPKSQSDMGAATRIPCGLAISCVGYQVAPLPGVPFDERTGVIPNLDGRVIQDRDKGQPLYVVGWAKRGAQGTIGTNRGDSEKTVSTLLHDLASASDERPSRSEVAAWLEALGCQTVSFSQWKVLDAIELRHGAESNRLRNKFTSVENMLRAINERI